MLPIRSITEPSACFANLPVSMLISRPSGRETVFVITFILIKLIRQNKKISLLLFSPKYHLIHAVPAGIRHIFVAKLRNKVQSEEGKTKNVSHSKKKAHFPRRKCAFLMKQGHPLMLQRIGKHQRKEFVFQSKWKTSLIGIVTGELSGFTSMMSAIMSHHFCVIGSTSVVS